VMKEMIASLDQGVGRIIETLKAHGLDRRTLVVFTSDNGGILTYAGGHTNISSNGALRGAKGSLYEGGHRVPTVAWWPGRIRAGTVTKATAMSVDLMPTFLELAQIDVSKAESARAMDGITLAPVLFEGRIPAERDLFWLQGEIKAVRRGPWKFIVPQGRQPELYNLDSDLGEKINLAAKETKRVAAMQSSLAAWERAIETGSPLSRMSRAK
jgi:arylsulfatase A